MSRKPIICVRGNEKGLKYRYSHIAYAGELPIIFSTDLPKREFEKAVDGHYTDEQIERFEETGQF
jgi:hypothetical protein